jgi:hypothetical protein
MVKNKYREVLLICGLIITIFLIYLPVVGTHFYHNITGTAEGINGSMDLSAANPSERKIYLDGQWEFYWKNFIISELDPLSKSDMMMKVPDEWSHYKVKGKTLPSAGFASYKLTLTDLSYDKSVALFIPDFGGAYRVFINGKLAAESGTLSKDSSKIFTVPKADLYPVTFSKATTQEVVIEVATTRFSGLYMTPVLGDYNEIVSENNSRNEVRLILFGIALFSFLSLIAMYMGSIRGKLHSFWMPIMILSILIRIMLTTEFYSFWQPILFFNISYESINELMYLVTFMLKYMLIFLVQEQCGITFDKREKIGFLIFYSFLYLTYLLVPQNIYNHYLSVIVPMFTFALDIYLFIKIYQGREKLMKFGMVVFLGTSLIIVGLAIDSYYINGKIHMNMSLTMISLFVMFLIIMNWVYTMRIGDLYDDFTIYSSSLETAQKQITMQKEYYGTLSRQMSEIREIKHDINHFVGVMSQLAEEGKLDRLRMFLSEYCEKVKMDQLPVFCQHTIANSIIGYYYLRAKEYGIPFESQCNICENTSISDNDLCIILGNALENAVYACRQVDPYITRFVTIKMGNIKGQCLIKVTNSHNGELKISEGRYISSKGGNSHGLGIRNIEKIVGIYSGFIKIEHNEKVFTLMAAVPEK